MSFDIYIKGPDFSDGNCSRVPDPDVFFPETRGTKEPGEKTLEIIRSLCNPCKRRQECLDFALDNDEQHGIWGGLTTKERNALPQTATRADQRSKNSVEVRRLMRLGLSLENACAEVGINVTSYKRSQTPSRKNPTMKTQSLKEQP